MTQHPTASCIQSRSEFAGNTSDTITLDETDRHRRRMVMTSDAGLIFLLDLPEARLLVEGDVLTLSDGTNIKVKAKSEPLLKITAKNHQHLVRLAWQIGNRHLPAQIVDDHILIRRDHVIADMLTGLGAVVEEVVAPFNPEGGAYHAHSHHHG